jgi:hypothetical protein
LSSNNIFLSLFKKIRLREEKALFSGNERNWGNIGERGFGALNSD